jgi:hypothetical protein
MYYVQYRTKNQDKIYRPHIWLNIDPLKVKQRIDRITRKLEKVRQEFESNEADNLSDKSP